MERGFAGRRGRGKVGKGWYWAEGGWNKGELGPEGVGLQQIQVSLFLHSLTAGTDPSRPIRFSYPEENSGSFSGPTRYNSSHLSASVLLGSGKT